MSTFTLEIIFVENTSAKIIQDLLRLLEPRRSIVNDSQQRQPKPPNMSVLHSIILEGLRDEVRKALMYWKDRLEKLISEASQSKSFKEEQNELLNLIQSYGAGDNHEEMIGTVRDKLKSLTGTNENKNLNTHLVEYFSAQDKQRDYSSNENRRTMRRILKDKGLRYRVRHDWITGGVPNYLLPSVEQSPYVTITARVNSHQINILRSDSNYSLQIFRFIVGAWQQNGHQSFEIPTKYMYDKLLASATWDSESLVFATGRGACFLFSNSDTWPENLRNAYQQTGLDLIESKVGRWASLGILNVWCDSVIQKLSLDPSVNYQSLKSLAALRRLFARLLTDRLVYQMEAGSLRGVSEQLNVEFMLDRMMESVQSKLEQVERLHELLLHVSALDQVRRERA